MLNTSRYRIICIGKIKKKWIQEGIETYLKRLPGLTIKELKDSNKEKESKEIITSLKKEESLIALTEKGLQEKLSHQ